MQFFLLEGLVKCNNLSTSYIFFHIVWLEWYPRTRKNQRSLFEYFLYPKRINGFGRIFLQMSKFPWERFYRLWISASLASNKKQHLWYSMLRSKSNQFIFTYYLNLPDTCYVAAYFWKSQFDLYFLRENKNWLDSSCLISLHWWLHWNCDGFWLPRSTCYMRAMFWNFCQKSSQWKTINNWCRNWILHPGMSCRMWKFFNHSS